MTVRNSAARAAHEGYSRSKRSTCNVTAYSASTLRARLRYCCIISHGALGRDFNGTQRLEVATKENHVSDASARHDLQRGWIRHDKLGAEVVVRQHEHRGDDAAADECEFPNAPPLEVNRFDVLQ